MSTNCLITKLKSTVEGNLPKLGTLEYQIVNNASDNEVGFKIGLVKGGFIKSDNIVFDVTKNDYTGRISNVSEFIAPSTELFIIIPKNLTGGETMNFNVDIYRTYSLSRNTGSTNFKTMVVPDISQLKYYGYYKDGNYNLVLSQEYKECYYQGSLKAADMVKINSFKRIQISGLYGNDDLYFDCGNINSEVLESLNFSFTNSAFNIESIIAPNLKDFGCVGTRNVSGDLKTWAENMHSLGRTSGTCAVSQVDALGHYSTMVWGGQRIDIAANRINPTITFTSEGVSIG